MCGRNASCCALLKRCTSSTNSTVRRPSAKRCPASASTCAHFRQPGQHRGNRAELGIGSTSRAAARASSCRSPADPRGSSSARGRIRSRGATRVPGAEQAALPDHFVERARAHALGERTQCVAIDAQQIGFGNRGGALFGHSAMITISRPPTTSTPFGGRRRTCPWRMLGFRFQPEKLELGALAQRIDDRMRLRPAVEAQARGFEGGVVGLRGRSSSQSRPSAVGSSVTSNSLSSRAGSTNAASGLFCFLHALRALGDLLQVRVVDPHGLPVGDDQLLVGLGVFPAEQARRGQRDAPARGFLLLAVGVEHLLRELPSRPLSPLVNVGQVVAAPRRARWWRTTQRQELPVG